jgi:hypothetical protein
VICHPSKVVHRGLGVFPRGFEIVSCRIEIFRSGTSDASTDTAPPQPPALTPPAGTPFLGMLTWLFEEIARWKKAEGFTDAIGRDLGIIGAAAQQHSDLPPLARGGVSGTNVELDFNLYEHTGIWVECQRQGDPAFAFLAGDTASPYVEQPPAEDPRPARMARLPRLLVGQRPRHPRLRPGAVGGRGRVSPWMT